MNEKKNKQGWMESLSQLWRSKTDAVPGARKQAGRRQGQEKNNVHQTDFSLSLCTFRSGGEGDKRCEKGAMERESPRKTDCTGEHER